MTGSNTRIEAALWYAQRGWPVLPIHTAVQGKCSCNRETCAHQGKHPRTRHGLKDATVDESTICGWWKTWSDANVAVLTGTAPGFIALDIDPRHGGDDNLHLLENEHGHLPDTVTALTGGGGIHKLFAHPGQQVRCRTGQSALLPGVELKADGGYIIVDPSIHLSGRPYIWEIGYGPYEIPIAELPPWLYGLIVKKTAHVRDVQAARIGDKIPQGKRNATLASFAGSMRCRGMSESAILAALLVENAERCDPPLGDEEVQGIARSIGRYSPGRSSPQHGTSIAEAAPAGVSGLRVHRITGPVPRPRSHCIDEGAPWPS